jgi:hypothetical protein
MPTRPVGITIRSQRTAAQIGGHAPAGLGIMDSRRSLVST